MTKDKIIYSVKNKEPINVHWRLDEKSYDWDVFICDCGLELVFEDHPSLSGYVYCPACAGKIIWDKKDIKKLKLVTD